MQGEKEVFRGDLFEGLYFILKGSINVQYKDCNILAHILDDDDVFGDQFILNKRSHLDYLAETDVLCLFVSASDGLELLKRYPQEAVYMKEKALVSYDKMRKVKDILKAYLLEKEQERQRKIQNVRTKIQAFRNIESLSVFGWAVTEPQRKPAQSEDPISTTREPLKEPLELENASDWTPFGNLFEERLQAQEPIEDKKKGILGQKKKTKEKEDKVFERTETTEGLLKTEGEEKPLDWLAKLFSDETETLDKTFLEDKSLKKLGEDIKSGVQDQSQVNSLINKLIEKGMKEERPAKPPKRPERLEAKKALSKNSQRSMASSLLKKKEEKKRVQESLMDYVDLKVEGGGHNLFGKIAGLVKASRPEWNIDRPEQALAQFGAETTRTSELLKDIEKESEDHSLDVRLDLSRKSTWKKVTISWLTIKEEEE